MNAYQFGGSWPARCMRMKMKAKTMRKTRSTPTAPASNSTGKSCLGVLEGTATAVLKWDSDIAKGTTNAYAPMAGCEMTVAIF